MAEAAMFSVASKLLSTIASPAFEKAYEKACSIWSAGEDLNKLRRSIETIQAVLLDAEKKQDSSAAVKSWIKRVRDVLYDADDLFDEVATDDMLGKRVNGNKLMKKVRAFTSSSLNPIVSNNSIAKRVKGIRKSLLEISEDMKQFGFIEHINEKSVSGTRRGQDPGLLFVGSEKVIGRDKDKKVILEMLVAESSRDVSVIGIVGIGGMGKTTLAQLVYSDDEVQKSFDQNRWFACISDTCDDKEVIGKIYHSICKEKYEDLTIIDLQNQLREKIKGMKFLLVLDDVWDDDRGRWQGRMSLLSGGAKGSKVVVTTRSESVARAVGAVETHHLEGLSEEESWDLFKSIVSFTSEQENDAKWINIGREIVKKCANVPLAIKSIASLLFEKNTIQEWESFMNEELSRLGQNHNDGIMPVLKLSYDHLSSNLKHCFAYCSLFPKDHRFDKDELIYLWISQGYIKTNNDNQNIEDVCHSYFMDLVRRSFFQYYYGTDAKWVKMHDLIHDLAQHVAGEESNLLTTSSNESNGTRHLSVAYAIDDSWVDAHQLHNVNRLRSFLYRGDYSSPCKLSLEKQFANFMSLRALSLRYLKIENIPSSIGGLKHLRYLDISRNTFKYLPDAITKLVNLYTLDISGCEKLEALPNHFRNLINLRNLINYACDGLMHMPPGFKELTSLQRLNWFSVGRGTDGGLMNKLDVLSNLKLRGELVICFKEDIDEWDEVECWQPPLTLQYLRIYMYKGLRLPHWGNERIDNQRQAFPLPQLTSLWLSHCSGVKFLPPFIHLPNLTRLILVKMHKLEYIDGEEEEGKQSLCASSLPNLKNLVLFYLAKLKGWSRKVETTTRSKEENVAAASTSTCAPPQLLSFPTLCKLEIEDCPELSHMPSCPSLHKLKLISVKAELIHQLLPIHDNSSSLESVTIEDCDELVSFPGESLTSLQHLSIEACPKLKQLHLAPSHVNILEYLTIRDCPELELWEEDNERIDNQRQTFLLPQLTHLRLLQCPRVKFLPPFKHLPNLSNLFLDGMEELEYIDGEEEEGKQSLCASISLPNLKKLELHNLRKLKGWSRKVETTTRSKEENVAASTSTCDPPQLLSFPTLCELTIDDCPELRHMLLCPSLHKLKLNSVKAEVIHQLLSIHDNSSSLEFVLIGHCDELVSFPGESLTSLQRLEIQSCPKLKQLHLAPSHLNILKYMGIWNCPELELWEEDKRGVDWDSLSKLTLLQLSEVEVPSSERLPDCLRSQVGLGKLEINVEPQFLAH